jgi:GntR family transcriptional regulator
LDRHLYLAYAELGVFVTQADDRVTALAADAAGAGQLDVSVAAPVLAIERIAYALDGRPVELRSSLFALAGAAYHGAFGQDART